MNRSAPSKSETDAPAENHPTPAGRAAAAAARVAARYAKAPSYSEMLAREARAAVHAAEAASKAAHEAQTALQFVLDDMEAAASATPAWEPEPGPDNVSERHAAPVAVPPSHQAHKPAESPRIHAEPANSAAAAPAIAPSWELEGEAAQDEPLEYDTGFGYDSPTITEVHGADPVQPIYANLIQFPREMVATRRARPRRAEGPLAATESAPQLSIFEVDPGAISILPPAATVDPAAEPAWMRTELPAMTPAIAPAILPSAITLDAQSPSVIFHAQPQEKLLQELREVILEEPEPQPVGAHEIELAPLSRRLLSVVVDCTLIAAALVTAAILAARNAGELPGLRAIEFGAVLALMLAGAAYYAGFLALTQATPGMKYAGIELNTFAGLKATRTQRCQRLMAMLLSVVPLGLGVVWALFDEGHLTWHDRLSGTYLRKR